MPRVKSDLKHTLSILTKLAVAKNQGGKVQSAKLFKVESGRQQKDGKGENQDLTIHLMTSPLTSSKVGCLGPEKCVRSETITQPLLSLKKEEKLANIGGKKTKKFIDEDQEKWSNCSHASEELSSGDSHRENSDKYYKKFDFFYRRTAFRSMTEFYKTLFKPHLDKWREGERKSCKNFVHLFLAQTYRSLPKDSVKVSPEQKLLKRALQSSFSKQMVVD